MKKSFGIYISSTCKIINGEIQSTISYHPPPSIFLINNPRSELSSNETKFGFNYGIKAIEEK
jgi:hypothetical protein